MTEKKIEPTIGKSMHYENFGPAEVVQFVVPTENNPHATGYVISGETRVRDYLNIANQLAEVEDITKDFSYDEKALQKDLAAYVEACDKADKMRWISYAVHNFEGNRNAIDNWYPEKEEVYAQYGQELIAAKEKGQSLDEVKTPAQRRPKLQQIFGKHISDLGLKQEIELLNPEELAVAKELFKDGFPSREILETTYKKYQDKADKIMAPFGHEKRQEMFATLMKRYGKSLEDDLIYGLNSQRDDEIYFMNEKEEAAFGKMSLKEVIEKYGIEKMWTCKGAVMIDEKIKASKDDPKKLAETLAQVFVIAQQQRKCFHVPLVTREFMLQTIEDAYHDMPQRKAEYGKFSAVDNGFRKIFAALKPQPDELKEVAELNKALKKDYSTSNKTLEFLQMRGEKLQELATNIDALLNQKIDVAKVKSDLKRKLNDTSLDNDTGGVIAADRHAQAVQQAKASGIHFKGGAAEIDFEAYRKEASEELTAKRTKRHSDLAEKRAKRQAKQTQR